jgi:membrane fusion protein (multidrug efflux system)
MGLSFQFASFKNASKRVQLFSVFFLVVFICIFAYGLYYYFIGSRYVSTDNAYVAAEIAQVTPSIGGTIKNINVKDTDRVKKGDVLVIIDDVDAKLAYLKVSAELIKAEAEREQAKLQFMRRKELLKTRNVSAEELSNAENLFKASVATFNSIHAAKMQAEVDLERTIIRAPVSGLVAKRMVQLGQRVQAGANLLSIVPLLDVHVDANFKEVQLKHIKIGQSVELTADFHGDKVKYHGTVEGIAGGTGAAFGLIPAQNATGNWIKVVQRLPVRIKLDQKELEAHPLYVGLSMYAVIDISQK